MRKSLLLLALALSAPAAAKPAVPLVPFGSGFGFAPEAPRIVDAGHPLYHRILIDPVENLPGHVGMPLARITNAREFSEAVAQTLDGAGLLATGEGSAKARLKVTWLGLDMPFHIGMSSRATMRLRYELRRIDNGQTIFARDISTDAAFSGGDGAQRSVGTARAAMMANLASAVLCLDKAAYGAAPPDCALRPSGRFAAPVTVFRPIYIRRR